MTIFLTALISVLATAVITIVLLNLSFQEKTIRYEIKSRYAVDEEQFKRSMGQLLPPPLTEGNRITALINGDEIFPAMLEAIRSAQRTVTFETYIYWSGAMGHAFAESLAERSRAGVRVHVLLDWAGCFKMDTSHLEMLRESGVQIELYHPLHWYNLSRMNNRTHRKLLVVDGRIGFTGGVGIADEWDGNAEKEDHYRDSHFRLEGPAVLQMQAAFMDNWLKTHNEVLHDEDYFPPVKHAGDCLAQVFKSGPSEGSESARLMYLHSIACARKRILLANSYFVPDELSVCTLVDARKRGVHIEIMVPGPKIDAAVTRRISRSLWGPLLEAEIEFYEYQPTLYHCKVMVVDDLWTSVGSTNFDNRSFRLNDECNLNILDEEFALQQAKIFEEDKKKCRRITLDEWKNRPWKEKVMERVTRIARSQF